MPSSGEPGAGKKPGPDSPAAETRARLQSLFMDAPIPIWEEDYSRVKKRLDDLVRRGAGDMDAYLEENPGELRHLARLVGVLNLNRVARSSAGLPQSGQVPGLETVFSEETYPVFKQQVLAIARGETSYSGYSVTTAGDGRRRHYVVHWKVMPGHEQNYSRVYLSAVDITETKAVEEALRHSETKFATAFRSSPDALIISSLGDGRYIDVNDSFLRISGYTREEIIGNAALAQAIWADSREREEFFSRLRRDGGVRDFPARFIASTGEHVRVSMSSEPIFLEREPCLLSIARDVTQLDETRNALIASEEKYRRLVEDNPAFILHVTPEGEILFFNRPLPGCTKEDMEDKNFEQFLQSEYRPEIHRILEESLKTGETRRMEAALDRAGGEELWFRIYVSPQRRGREADSLLLGCHDISETRRAEQALKESEEKYRTLVEAATDGIIILQDGLIRFANPSVVEISGYSRKELEGRSFLDFVDPRDRERVAAIHARRAQGEDAPSRYEARILPRSGDCVDIEINITPFRFAGRPASLAILRDVTERRRSDKSNRRLNP